MLISQLQEVSDYYYTRLRAAQEAFSHPRLPPTYHQFLAERETWKHYCKVTQQLLEHGADIAFALVEDEFPGKDPLYDCLVAALNHIEREPERHMKSEGDATQDTQIEGLKQLMRQLESLVLQKDSVIKSKDDLLKIKGESLVATRELMSEKDRIIQVC
jgi:hypothetical protein